MRSKRLIYVVVLVLIGGAVAYLFSSAFESALQYYVTVAELQSAPPPADRILKVGGLIKEGSLRKTVGNRVVYSFIIKQGLNELPVRYSGIVPDTFKEGGEVVATGHLGPDGTFEATKILAKCASKYQAAS